MLNVDRRRKYSGMGSTVNKSDVFVKINFDLEALSLMCCFILSENASIRRSDLVHIRNLFSIIDLEVYKNDIEKMKRVNFIKRALEAKLLEGYSDPYIIVKYVNGGVFGENILDPDTLRLNISNVEAEWVKSTVSEALKYSFIDKEMHNLMDVCARYQASDWMTRGSIVKEIEELVTDMMQKFRRTRTESLNEATFSLRNGVFEETVTDIHAQLKNPSSRLKCGMQGLNEMTSGGFENGRVYMFLGLSGGFKSGTLLSLAYQVKKYNKNYKCKDPSKIPCIVILTQENTVKESVQRLFNMTTTSEDIRNFEANQVIHMLRTEGELYLNDESPIDIIIKYKPNNSIDTSYLYTLVEDLEDEGYECICLIQDYVKRIRATYRQSDVRLELGEVINEFKVFAGLKDIPVLTAAQINREGAKVVDAGLDANRYDLTRMLGRANIGESLLMLDNIDCAFIVGRDHDINGAVYLSFNLIKLRYGHTDLKYMSQPFVHGNDIKLIEDYYNPVPLYKTTLKPNPDELIASGAVLNRQSISRRDLDEVIKEKQANTAMFEDDNIFELSKYRQIKETGYTTNDMQPIVTSRPSIPLVKAVEFAS